LNDVRSTARFASAESRNSVPTTIITVDAVRGLRRAANTSTAAVSREIVDSRPLDDMPSTSSPSVEKKSRPPRNPSTPKTAITAATASAPTRCTVKTRES
jgi:hypothetical protein